MDPAIPGWAGLVANSTQSVKQSGSVIWWNRFKQRRSPLPALQTVSTQLYGWDREPDIEGIERERTATSLVLTVR